VRRLPGPAGEPASSAGPALHPDRARPRRHERRHAPASHSRQNQRFPSRRAGWPVARRWQREQDQRQPGPSCCTVAGGPLDSTFRPESDKQVSEQNCFCRPNRSFLAGRTAPHVAQRGVCRRLGGSGAAPRFQRAEVVKIVSPCARAQRSQPGSPQSSRPTFVHTQTSTKGAPQREHGFGFAGSVSSSIIFGCSSTACGSLSCRSVRNETTATSTRKITSSPPKAAP
jgi:hypothetical protein